jgi:hypothetical protein
MKLSTPSFSVLGLLLASAVASADDGEWKPLFNGKDLSGWEVFLAVPPNTVDLPGEEKDAKGNYTKALGINHDPLKIASVVEVEGKPAIRLTSEIHGGVTTVNSFSNYHLRLQFKWGDKRKGQKPEQTRNSGVIYHAFGPQGGVKTRWMSGHQFQIQEGNCGDYVAMGDAAGEIPAEKIDGKKYRYRKAGEKVMFGNTVPAGPNCAKDGDKLEKPVGEWNTLEIICVGDECAQSINGQEVLRVKSFKTAADGKVAGSLSEGRIQLQMEGWELYFRNIELRPLTAWPK